MFAKSMGAVVLAVLLSCAVQRVLGVSPGERQALLDVFTSTDGPAWVEADNWTSPTVDPCLWFGVGCNPAGGVVKLHLSKNNLSGSLPSSFGQLSFLT